ncbi:MAG: hypothetical protein ACE362_12015 [Phaeodactylibacter xiamenensis]|nr:hypothetical protein [Phaeodactylibacter xiamenensis]MCR9055324.1 hypothetical protein [bacterium]
MHSTKLARTIGAFATDELKAVRKAILQKARHRDSPVVKLWDALVPHHPEFDDEQLDLKYLFKKAYRGEDYEPQKLRNLMTTLQQYIEQYLIDAELQAQPQTQHLLLIQALHKRRRTGAFEKALNDGLKKLESAPDGLLKLQARLALLHERYFFDNIQKNEQRTEDLHQLAQALNEMLAHQLLIYGIDRSVRRMTLPDDTTFLGLEEALSFASSDEAPELLEFFQQLWKLYTGGVNDALFLKLKAVFFVNYGSWEEFEVSLALKTLISYLAPLVAGNKEPYISQLFELFQFGYAQELIVVDNQLTATRFLNSVVTGLMVRKFDWVEQFIDSHAVYLLKDKAETLTLAQVYLLYYKGWHTNAPDLFDKALEIMRSTPHDGWFFKLRLRMLEVRIFCDTYGARGHSVSFVLDRISSFRRFIDRSGNGETAVGQRYKKCLGYCRQVIKMKSLPYVDPLRKRGLTDEIMAEQHLMLKDWLLYHLDKL